jgi:hypothetical protein
VRENSYHHVTWGFLAKRMILAVLTCGSGAGEGL